MVYDTRSSDTSAGVSGNRKFAAHVLNEPIYLERCELVTDKLFGVRFDFCTRQTFTDVYRNKL